MDTDYTRHLSAGMVVGTVSRWARVLTACFLLLVVSCAKMPPTLEPADLPVSLVIERLEQKRDQFTSFRAVGTLRIEAKKQQWSGKAFLLSQVPRSLRLEIVGLWGQPLLYVVSDGASFLSWEPGRDRAYRGLAAGDTLASIIDFPIGDQEAVLLLAGIVPRWGHGEASLYRERDTEALVLVFENESSRLVQRVRLDAADLAVTEIERLHGSNSELVARFNDFVAIDGFVYPKNVALEGGGIKLKLKYQQFAINEALDQDAFQLALPEGVEILPW
jgi:hypothetical protein